MGPGRRRPCDSNWNGFEWPVYSSRQQNIFTPGSWYALFSHPFKWLQSAQPLIRVCLVVTPWTAARQASLSFTDFHSLLRLMSIELVMPSNHLILCRPFLLLPSILASYFCIPVPYNEKGTFFGC